MDAAKSAAGLLVMEDPVIYSVRGKIADLSARLRLPALGRMAEEDPEIKKLRNHYDLAKLCEIGAVPIEGRAG